MENKTYTPNEIAAFIRTMIVYNHRGNEYIIAQVEQKSDLPFRKYSLLDSIRQVKGIPEEIRGYLTSVRADNKTLDGLEKECQEN